MQRIAIIAAVALLLAACGGDDAVDTTAPSESTEAGGPAEFVVTETEDGAMLRVRPGDTVRARMTVSDPAVPGWIVSGEPDPAVLRLSDSLLWLPSDPAAGGAYFEFAFVVVGPGSTSVSFTHGPSARTVGYTVVAAAEG